MRTAYKAHDVLWIAFDPAIGKRALLNEVYTERPDDWALRYRLDATQEPGVVVTSDRDIAIAAAARREERARILQVLAVMRQDVQRVLDLALKAAGGDDEDEDVMVHEHAANMCQARLPSPPGVCEQCGGEF